MEHRLYDISYSMGSDIAFLGMIVEAQSEEDAIERFRKHKPNAIVFGASELNYSPKPGQPILYA